MSLESLEPLPDERFQSLEPLPAASNMEVISGVPERAGLKFIETAGGATRILGDLLRIDSLSEVGAEIAKNAAGAAQESMPIGATPGQQIVSSGLESALTMAPAMGVTGAAMVGTGLVTGAATAGAPRYSELRDKGFSGGRAGLHAAIDATAEALGEFVSLPVLAAGTRPILNKFVHFLTRDLAGEEFTYVAQTLNAMMADRPDLTWREFLEGAATTALVTPIAAGGQMAMATGAQGVRSMLTPTPPPAQPPAPPPMLLLPPPKVEPPAPISQPEPPPSPEPPVAPAPISDLPPGPKETGMWIPQPDGSMVHPATGALIENVGDMWEVRVANKHGEIEVYSIGETLEEALENAKQLEWDTPLPSDWRWVGADATHATGYSVHVIGLGTGYGLVSPEGAYVRDVPGNTLAEAIEAATKAIGQDLGPPPAPTPTPPARIGYSSRFELSPTEAIALGRYDPIVFHGMSYLDGGIARVMEIKKVFSAGGGFLLNGKHYASAEDVFARIAKITGSDPTAPATYTRAYNQRLLAEIAAKPELVDDLFPEVHAYFGDKITDVATASHARKAAGYTQLGETSYMPFLSGGVARSTGIESDLKPGVVLLAPDGTGVTYTGIPGSHKNFTPTTLRTANQNAKFRRLQGFVEYLRAKYLSDSTVILAVMPDNGLSYAVQGTLDDRTYIIYINPHLMEANNQSWLQSVAHEFGHAVVARHFADASPVLQAHLYASWLTYTKGVKKDTTLQRYLTEHNLDPRDANAADTVGMMGHRANYFLSLSEYLADQASHYFIFRTNAVTQSTPHSKALHDWFDSLVHKLKQLWITLGTRFKENRDFRAWLDSLAPPDKVSSYALDTKDSPGITAGGIKTKPPPKPITPTDKGHALALTKLAGEIMEALHEAGASKEEVDALSPTGSILDLNWNAAIALLDKYGATTRYFKSRLNQIDDTFQFREGLMRMSQSIHGDQELRQELGKSNAAVKSFNWILQKTMTAVQLRKRFGATVQGVKNFVDNLEKMFAYRSRWKEMADERIKEMKNVSREQRMKVFEALLEEDKTGNYISTITVQGIPQRRVFTVRPEEAKRLGLNEMGVKLYSHIRSDFDNALAEMEVQAIEELHRLYSTTNPHLQKAEADLRHAFAEMRARPYVPHTRFGEHTITVREKGVVREFYQFESERAAKAAESALREEYGNSAQVSRGRIGEQARVMMGLPPHLVTAMKGQLKMTDEQIQTFESLLKDMSHGASFVRRFKRRKNIAGWEDDADQFPRAYADYMSRFANHISRIRYNHTLSGSVAEVRAQALQDAKLGVNTVELNNLANWLTRLQEYVNEPGVEYVAARAAATIWYLGFSPKSALVNATSVPMVTAPYLSKRFGMAPTMAALTQAYRDVAKMFVRPEALTDEERKFMQSLREAGRIDASFASELAGLREGGKLVDRYSLGQIGSAGFQLRYYAMWMFQKMEIINREVTALAAYRLSKDKSKSFLADDPMGFDKKAAEFASNTIQDTQNENAQWNRAEFMRGRKSILTMFMSYQQNAIYQMFGGDESWMRLLAVQMMVAGLLGVPFAKDLDELIKWFSRRVFGSDVNAERAVREYLKDVTGAADWILNGAAHNVFGPLKALGLDMPGVNISGSLSQGRVIPGVDALAAEGDFAKRLENAAGDVGGAGFSIILNMLKTLSSNDPADLQRMSRMLPEFARAWVEGGNMLASGKALDGKGNELAQVSNVEAIIRASGFQLTTVSKERAKHFAQKDVAQYWLTRREFVLDLYEKGRITGDHSWNEKANAALREFNDEVPDRALAISAKQLRESMKRRAMAKARAEHDLGPNRTLDQTYRRIGDLY